ncbi:hypothetical protein [Arthrobacter ginkgonis]|uniref:hypothetical protein n=1 Tax=Arthrobacter ginkgonis TaxID=1630594 RepID=UPI0031E82687
MNLLHLIATTATQTDDAAREIGPGFVGFVFTAFVAIGVILLARDMQRRIRRVRYMSETEQRQQDMVERGRELQPDDDAPAPRVDKQRPGTEGTGQTTGGDSAR